jgi:hypothetical protein
MDDMITEESKAVLPPEKAASSRGDSVSIAYDILLLQQRLEAYERLHREEIAELRYELDRLRRAFLQDTRGLRAVSSSDKTKKE